MSYLYDMLLCRRSGLMQALDSIYLYLLKRSSKEREARVIEPSVHHAIDRSGCGDLDLAALIAPE